MCVGGIKSGLFYIQGWGKSFTIFSEHEHKLTALDAFSEVIKMTNRTGL